MRWVLAHEIASALRHEDRLADGHDQQYNKERKDRSAVPYGAGVYAPLRCSSEARALERAPFVFRSQQAQNLFAQNLFVPG